MVRHAGTLDLDNLTISGEGSKGPGKPERAIKIEPEPVSPHMQNFLECVRSRQTPRCDIQAGFSHAVAGCMAAAALQTGRIRFDRSRLELI